MAKQLRHFSLGCVAINIICIFITMGWNMKKELIRGNILTVM